MRHEHRFGTLHVRVAGHDRFAGRVCLQHKSIGPCGQRLHGEADLLAHVKAQVCGDLFVAAATGVQLQAQ